MQKRFLIPALAVIGSFVVGSSVLAASGVAYKKRLDVPMVPANILNTLSKTNWQHPSTTPGKLVTYKNTILQKPVITDEQECGDIMYRMWAVAIDVEATKKTQPTIKASENPQRDTRYVFEARTPKAVKWHTDETYQGTYDKTHPVPTQFFGCKGQDVVVRYSSPTMYHNMTGVYEGPGEHAYKSARFADFQVSTAWKNTLPSLGQRNYTRNYVQPVVVDGILQDPGQLYAAWGYSTSSVAVAGDSKIVTSDAKNGTHVHALPRYRDLNALSNEERSVDATFYRTKDGYAVKEVALINEGGTARYRTTYYRIYNGEARYSVVESLPIMPSGKIEQSDTGLLVMPFNHVEGGWARILTHGLPTTGYTASGNIVWETDAQIYLRYTITEIKTGKQQYWEATVNKK